MGRPIIPVPIRHCRHCGKVMERKRFNGTLESRLGYSRRKFCDQVCMSEAMMKDRCSSVSHSRMKASKTAAEMCEACGATGRLHVHHIDEDPFNNTPSNLRTLCARCHRRSHSPNFMADGVTPKPCEHCANPSVKRGLCSSHLNRLRRHGDPLAVKVRTASGWILDTSGLPIRSHRSPATKKPEWRDCADTETP